MTSRWFMPVSTTAHVFYCTSVFKETGVFVMFAFLGRVSYASWQVLPFICWTHVTTQRGACWRIEINSLTHCTKIIIPCKQLISPTPNERQTTASNRLLLHRACASSSRPTWGIWCQFHLSINFVLEVFRYRRISHQKRRQKNDSNLRRSIAYI